MTEKLLIESGYTLQNAQIKSADLSMEDHCCFVLNMVLEGAAWGCVYGGICLGKGRLNGEDKEFQGSVKGLEYIMRIMNTVGVSKFNDLEGKYVRVATKGWGSSVKIIGNIIKDRWFDPEEFFEKRVTSDAESK